MIHGLIQIMGNNYFRISNKVPNPDYLCKDNIRTAVHPFLVDNTVHSNLAGEIIVQPVNIISEIIKSTFLAFKNIMAEVHFFHVTLPDPF